MTGLKFARFIRSQTKTNSTTYPDARLLEDINIVKDEIVEAINDINEDYFGMLAYRNLIHDQREYSMPEFMLSNMKTLEVALTDEVDSEGNLRYVHADEFDLTTYNRSTDEAVIRKNFWNRKPAFDIFRNALWVFSGGPIIDVFDGLKLYYMRYPNDLPLSRLSDDLADLSNDLILPISAGIPRQLHKVWARKVIILFKNSREKPIPLTETEKNVDLDLETALAKMSGTNLDRDRVATVPRYNDGYDY